MFGRVRINIARQDLIHERVREKEKLNARPLDYHYMHIKYAFISEGQVSWSKFNATMPWLYKSSNTDQSMSCGFNARV